MGYVSSLEGIQYPKQPVRRKNQLTTLISPTHMAQKKGLAAYSPCSNPMPLPPQKKRERFCFSTKTHQTSMRVPTDRFKFASQNASTIANVELLRLDISLWLKTSSHHRPIGAARCKKIWVLRSHKSHGRKLDENCWKFRRAYIKTKSLVTLEVVVLLLVVVVISSSSSSIIIIISSSSSNIKLCILFFSNWSPNF